MTAQSIRRSRARKVAVLTSPSLIAQADEAEDKLRFAVPTDPNWLDKACRGEVRVTDPETGGQKGSKPAVLGDLDPMALTQVAEVAGFGRQKYERLNYAKGFAWSLSYDALQRHLHQFWNREEIDGESGLHHLAHAAWQCLCLLSFVLRSRGTDDRMV